MKIKCIVKGCENHKNEGGFEDGICLPCYLFITTGEGVYSQAYRNSHPVKELTLTDEEIAVIWANYEVPMTGMDFKKVVEAILRKAQEK